MFSALIWRISQAYLVYLTDGIINLFIPIVDFIGGMEWRHWRMARPGSGGNGGGFDADFAGEEVVQPILLLALVNHCLASSVVLTTRSAFQNTSGSSNTRNDVRYFAQVRYRSSMNRCSDAFSAAKFGL